MGGGFQWSEIKKKVKAAVIQVFPQFTNIESLLEIYSSLIKKKIQESRQIVEQWLLKYRSIF